MPLSVIKAELPDKCQSRNRMKFGVGLPLYRRHDLQSASNDGWRSAVIRSDYRGA